MNATATRTDIHRPGSDQFDPEKYTCYGVWDMSPEYPDPVSVQIRMQVIRDLTSKGYTSGAGSSRQCGHCGTHIRYAALMVRDDVREFIYVGETCLEGRFEDLTADQFHTLRKAAKLNRDRATKRERIAGLVDAHPLLVWATYPETLSYGFVEEVAQKFRANGELSDRQIEAFEKAIVRDTARADADAAREVARVAKVAAGVQVPTGRFVIAGTVDWEGMKEDSYSGYLVHKMIVESPDGWKVWVTVPAAIEGTEQYNTETGEYDRVGGITAGMRVEFTATVTPKDTDPTFGFAKRPSKARVL